MKMKKFHLQLAAILLSLAVIGLLRLPGDSLAADQDNDRIQVVASSPLVKNIVAQIGGAKVTVESIIQGPNCQHEYEASAGDMKRLAVCKAFFKIGMGSDVWADKLASGALNKKALFIDASRNIKPIKADGLINPHYWGSPDNVKLMAKNILEGLCSAAPDQKPYFTTNFQNFIRKLDRTVAELKAKAKTVADKEFVSYSNAFPYFYRYFGFKNIATVERSCEREVTPREIATAAKLMKAKKIRVLVGDAAEPDEPNGLAKETRARKILLWAATDNSNDYLETLRRNVTILVEALQ